MGSPSDELIIVSRPGSHLTAIGPISNHPRPLGRAPEKAKESRGLDVFLAALS